MTQDKKKDSTVKSEDVKTEKKKTVKSKTKSIKELKQELSNIYLEVRMGKESDTSKIKKIKKQIARQFSSKNKTK